MLDNGHVSGALKRAAGLAALVALGGCQFAQGPTILESQASIPNVPPDRARIFVYRPYNYIASAGSPTVVIDKSIVGEAMLVGAFYCDVAPGSHGIWSPQYAPNPTLVNLAGGQVVYLRVSPNLSTGYDFDAVTAATGAAEIQSMHLVSGKCDDLAGTAVAAAGGRPLVAGDRPPIDDVLVLGAAAEERGDLAGALNIYTASLQKYVTRLDAIPDVVNRAIDVGIKMRPPPQIPDSARRHATAAANTIKEARTKADFAVARREYADALAQAPWWGDVWVNLSLVDEQVGSSADVRRDLTWYLRANPDAPDQAEVRRKIDALGRTVSP